MSGTMPRHIADAATGLALKAEAAAAKKTPFALVKERFLAGQAAKEQQESEPLNSRTWREMSQRARWLCCTMASKCDDAERAARKPWGSFTQDERNSMAAFARSMRKDFAGAEGLH